MLATMAGADASARTRSRSRLLPAAAALFASAHLARSLPWGAAWATGGRRPALLAALGLAGAAGGAGADIAGAAAQAKPDLCDEACLRDLLGKVEAPNSQELERKLFFSTDEESISYQYGTVKLESVRTLLGRLEIDGSDVFTDLGSGIGNVVLQAFASTPVKAARGIEYIQERHEVAVQLGDKFRREHAVDPSRQLQFVRGDLCVEDFSDSTILLATSQCFSDKVLKCMWDRAASLPRLRYLATLKPLPAGAKGDFKLLGEIPLATSWSGAETYYVYSRVPGTRLL